MSWNFSSIFSLFKSEKSGPSSHFDLKLLRQTQGKSMPSLKQLKYLGSFLNKKEKNVLFGASSLLLIVIIGWISYIISTNSILVPKNGGEYSEGLVGQPKYINPIFASTNDIDADLTKLVYSGLFKYANNKIVPDLADSFSIGADQKTYDIKLKPNLKWSDGEPLTVDDILFTFDMIQNVQSGSPLVASFQGVRLDKTGDDTLRFTLKTPYAPFLQSLTVGILPEHSWSEIPPANIRLAKYNIQPIGSGAWKFSKMVKDTTGNIQTYTFVPNENFYDKKPYLQTLTFKFFDNYNDAVTALKSQNILGLSFVPHNLKEKVSGKNYNLFSTQLPQYTALFFNQSIDADLKNNELRLALAKAIDKSALISEALDGDGMAIDQPILPGNLGYNPDIKKTIFDIAGANQALDKTYSRLQPEEYFKIRHDQILSSLRPPTSTKDKAPVQVSAVDESRINDTIRAEMASGQTFYRKDGKTDVLRITITTADTPEYTKTAQSIAKMWNLIGVQTSIKTVGSRQIIRDALKDRDYEVLIYGEMIGADPDLYSFWHSSQVDYPGLNLAKFSDRDSDKLLEDARATLDTDTRAKLYQKFQNILADELPAIFLYSPTYVMSISKDIHGVEITNLVNPSDRFGGLNNWYTKTSRQRK